MSSCDKCNHNMFCKSDVWTGYICNMYGYEIEKIPLENKKTIFQHCKYAKIKHKENIHS